MKPLLTFDTETIMHTTTRTVSLLTLMIAVASSSIGRSEESTPAHDATASESNSKTVKPEGKVLRHAVFFKFKDGTSEADEKKIVAAFDELPKKIDSVKGYERGKNTSAAKLDDGFTHCFFLTFADEEGRANYLPHPEHKAFVDVLLPHLDKAFVVDYWGKAGKPSDRRQLRHGVFLKFREGATPEQIKDIEESFAKLPSECPTIKAFEWGQNNSPEKHDDGFTHCYMFTFDDPKGLKEYAVSPAHTALVAKIPSAGEKARVLDFWSKEEAGQK